MSQSAELTGGNIRRDALQISAREIDIVLSFDIWVGEDHLFRMVLRIEPYEPVYVGLITFTVERRRGLSLVLRLCLRHSFHHLRGRYETVWKNGR